MSVSPRRACLSVCLALVLPVLPLVGAERVEAGSAYNPRHSGLEPPGGPRGAEALPGQTAGRTDDGGMGYTDAYGRRLQNSPPPERASRNRPGPGAYGGYARDREAVRPLPEVEKAKPAWNFN